MYIFFDRPQLILFSIILLGLSMLIVMQSRRYVLWYIAAFVLGPIILDIPGTYLGLWSFSTPDVLGFPFWLPFWYGNIVISFLYFSTAIQRRMNKD
jgi:hypothetical protein